MNKILKFGLPISVGVVAASVPIGYVAYTSANPKHAVESKVIDFWEMLDQQFINSFKLLPLTDDQIHIAEAASGYIHGMQVPYAQVAGKTVNNIAFPATEAEYISQHPGVVSPVYIQINHEYMTREELLKEPAIINYINVFKDTLAYSPIFEDVWMESFTDKETFSMNVFPYDREYSFNIASDHSDITSTVFGLGYENSVYELFNNAIPSYIKKIVDAYPGDSRKQYQELVSPESTFKINWPVYQNFIEDIYGVDGNKISNYNILEMYCLAVGKSDVVKTTRISPSMQPIYEIIPNVDKDLNFNRSTINYTFDSLDARMQLPERALANLLGNTFNEEMNGLKIGNKMAPFTERIAKAQSGTARDVNNLPLPGDATDQVKLITIKDIPFLMGMTPNTAISFEYGISQNSVGYGILPPTVPKEQRTNRFFYGGNFPIYSFEQISQMSDERMNDEILNFFYNPHHNSGIKPDFETIFDPEDPGTP